MRKRGQPGRLSQVEDNELIDRFRKQGDRDALGELFQRYAHLVLGVCLKYLGDADEAQDATMQVYERLFESLKKHEITQFRGWLVQVARNHCLMILRSRKTQRQRQDKYLTETEEPVVEFSLLEHRLDEKEMALTHLEECLEGLGTDQGTCVRLFFYEKKSYQEIAQLTGFDLKSVKSYLQNGKRNLRLCMETKTDG